MIFEDYVKNFIDMCMGELYLVCEKFLLFVYYPELYHTTKFITFNTVPHQLDVHLNGCKAFKC